MLAAHRAPDDGQPTEARVIDNLKASEVYVNKIDYSFDGGAITDLLECSRGAPECASTPGVGTRSAAARVCHTTFGSLVNNSGRARQPSHRNSRGNFPRRRTAQSPPRGGSSKPNSIRLAGRAVRSVSRSRDFHPRPFAVEENRRAESIDRGPHLAHSFVAAPVRHKKLSGIRRRPRGFEHHVEI